ncbi:universal stress protein [Dactylosporangium sp. NPDC051485]|uniref:universal stress protein n=1 Tax=Dactylosporangium sp. NPDC051485 TaxID=3154846 RepID=UPI00343DE3F0
MNGTDVVVGIDGTPACGATLQWAADEAARSDARLRVVVAFPGDDQDDRSAAVAAAEAAAAVVRGYRPGLDATGSAVPGDPATVLQAMAADAALVVVGSRGHTALSAALGSGSGTRVALRAPGCIAVVRGRAGAAGPVVVGLDGSPTDNRLLATAFEHAARRGCEVVAVRVLNPLAVPWGGVGIAAMMPGPVSDRATVLAELTDDVGRWHEKYPTVPATARVPIGEPTSVLLDASGEAQLLVLGGRAHGPAAALLAGSVVQRLLFHAECPLLIAHGERDA